MSMSEWGPLITVCVYRDLAAFAATLLQLIGVVREEIVEEHRGRHGERQARR
jgi:hypothetical protein